MWAILPIFTPLKVYNGDELYKEHERSEEIFFVLKGRVKLYIDVNKSKEDIVSFKPPKPKLIPFKMYVEGSHFGDSDVFADTGKGRDSTAIAESECHLLVISKN